MKCKYCQTEIDNDSVFCPNCGKKLSEPTARPQSKNKPRPKLATPRKGTEDRRPNNAWWLILMAAVLCIGLYFLFFHSSDGKKRQKDRIEAAEDEIRKAIDDSIYQAKAAMEQQQKQDSLMKVVKVKSDSLALIRDSLKNITSNKKKGAKHNATTDARQQTAGSRRSSASVPVIQRDPSLVVGTKNLGYGTFKGTLKNGLPHDVSGRLIFKTAHLIDSRDPKGRIAEQGDYVIGEFSDGHLVQGIWYGPDRQVKGSIIIGK